MTQPALARSAQSGRYYEIPGHEKKLPSVTTVIGVLNKPALPRWAAKAVAEWVAENVDEVRGLVAKDKAAAIDAMKGSPWRQMLAAGDIGTAVHAIAEWYVLHGEGMTDEEHEALYARVDPGAVEMIWRFEDFLKDHTPTFLATEMTVANLTEGYAGTLDAIMDIGGRTLIVDYKTGKGVYPEAALQLAGLRHAEFGVLPNGERVEIPKIVGGAVLHLRPDGYRLIPVRCDESVFEAFLGCIELWHWQTDAAPSVLGVPAAVAQATLAVVE